jgi:hypothetical protein
VRNIFKCKKEEADNGEEMPPFPKGGQQLTELKFIYSMNIN